MVLKLFVVLCCALGMALSHPVRAELYRCEIVDGASLINGRIGRDASTAAWAHLQNPIVVDTDSGYVRLGTDGKGDRWAIRQRGNSSYDFVAVSNRLDPESDMGSILSLRVWERPVQALLVTNHFSLSSGTCSPLR